MVDMQKRHWGEWEKVESHILMAGELGMTAGADGLRQHQRRIRGHAGRPEGTGKYAGGRLRERAQLLARPLPDWTADIERFRSNQEKIRAAGLLGVLYLPWCFHAVATGMGLEHLCYELYDDPDFVRECCRWVEERNREAIRRIVSVVRPDWCCSTAIARTRPG